MKDRNGTRIRSGSYLVYEDSSDIFKVAFTGNYVNAYPVHGWVLDHADPVVLWKFSDEDMPDTLVIPRRMVVPKLKLDQIKLYIALAGLDVVEEDEEDE